MSIVALTVECEAANNGRCFTRELVQVAEEHVVPMTWLIYVSEREPWSNINLYHAEYLHRIPSWHEFGLLLDFQKSGGYISDPVERGDAIRLGKDVLKACHIKPTSFRAHDYDLLPSDLKYLEDIGILVDSSETPGAQDRHGVTQSDGPHRPFHPSYADLSTPGEARILTAPIATHNGVSATLDKGWPPVESVVSHSLENEPVTVVTLTDTADCRTALDACIKLAKSRGARFVTLTSLAS